MRKQQNIILTAIISLTLLADPALAQSLVGKVVSVADGDTITILDGDRTQHKIRLSGIDAPERSQAFGRLSREHLASLVAGEKVAVETDKTDRFGRSVGKVLLHGRDINLTMVAAGLAWHYKSTRWSSQLWIACRMRTQKFKRARVVQACGAILSRRRRGTGGQRSARDSSNLLSVRPQFSQ